jgi:acyl carrier protein
MELEDRLGIELAPELLFEYPTLAGLSRHLATLLPSTAAVA